MQLIIRNLFLFVCSIIVLCGLLAVIPDNSAGTPFGRFKEYLALAFSFDFGLSTQYGSPVADIVANRAQKTILLIFGSMITVLIVAIPLGITTALNSKNRLQKMLLQPLYFLSSIPVLIWGTALWGLSYLGFNMVLFYEDLGDANLMEGLVIVCFPVLALSIGDGMLYDTYRTVRNEVRNLFLQPWIKGLRSRGRSIYGHIARGLIEPLAISFTSKLTYLISGAIVVEFIFNWKGLGMLIWETIRRPGAKDYPVIIAAVIVLIILVILSSFLRDLIHLLMNPHLREVD